LTLSLIGLIPKSPTKKILYPGKEEQRITEITNIPVPYASITRIRCKGSSFCRKFSGLSASPRDIQELNYY
jgi:hypothetical protein